MSWKFFWKPPKSNRTGKTLYNSTCPGWFFSYQNLALVCVKIETFWRAFSLYTMDSKWGKYYNYARHDYLKAKIDVFEYFFFTLFQKGSPKMHFKSFFKKKICTQFWIPLTRLCGEFSKVHSHYYSNNTLILAFQAKSSITSFIFCISDFGLLWPFAVTFLLSGRI